MKYGSDLSGSQLRWVTMAFLCMVVLSVNVSYGAWPTSPATSLATFQTSGPLAYSLSFSDGKGGTFAIFRKVSESAPRVRHIDSTGTGSVPPDGQFIWTDAVSHYPPTAAPDGKGGLLVIRSSRPDLVGAGAGLYVQRISAGGSRLWGDNGVFLSSAGTEGFTVDNDANGGAYVAWHEDKGWGTAIYAQRVSEAGVAQWVSGGITIADAEYWQMWPLIVAEGGGSAIVAWQDYRNGKFFKMYAQYIDPDGTVRWTPNGIKFCYEEEGQLLERGIADGLGGAIFAWLEGADSGTNVHAQRISKTGELRWSDDGVNVTPFQESQISPQLAPDGVGGAYVAWQDFYGDYQGDVYAQRIQSDGQLAWYEEGEVVVAANGYHGAPAVSMDGDGGMFVAWEGPGGYNVHGNYDTPNIHTQRLEPDGDKLFSSNLSFAPVTDQAGHHYLPSLFADNKGGAVATWYVSMEEEHSQETRIFAARMRYDGSLGADPSPIPRDLSGIWKNASVTTKSDGSLKAKGKLVVSNIGSIATPSFTVRVVLSADTKYDSSDPIVETKTVKSLKGQASAKISASEVINPQGVALHYMIGIIDLPGTVAESDEANNAIVLPF